MYPDKIAGSVQQVTSQQKTEHKQSQQSGNGARQNQAVLDQQTQELDRLSQGRMAAEQKKDDKDKEDKEKSDSLLSEDLTQIQEATNELLAQMNVQLDFEINDELERVIVKVKNRESGEVIRQVPPEEILQMAKRMEEMSGMLLDKWS